MQSIEKFYQEECLEINFIKYLTKFIEVTQYKVQNKTMQKVLDVYLSEDSYEEIKKWCLELFMQDISVKFSHESEGKFLFKQ